MSGARTLALALEGITERQATNRDIVEALCNSIRAQVLDNILEYPDTWDGHEMRELLAIYFERERTAAMADRRSKRYRAFESFYLQHVDRWRHGWKAR